MSPSFLPAISLFISQTPTKVIPVSGLDGLGDPEVNQMLSLPTNN